MPFEIKGSIIEETSKQAQSNPNNPSQADAKTSNHDLKTLI